jgi:hypothetical protein
MRTRREVLAGGFIAVLFARESLGRCGHAAEGGCLLSPARVDRVPADRAFRAADGEPISLGSGDKDFDLALAQTLSHICDVFEVLPGFAFFDDAPYRNAYAVSKRWVENSDGTVLFGKRLLASLMCGHEVPDIRVAAVCAHEFGHIVQIKRGVAEKIGSRVLKPLELHADFLAGFYAGVRKTEHPAYPAAAFVSGAREMGDKDLHNRDHHGTGEERAAAVARGFAAGYCERRTLAEAVGMGITYVTGQ